MIVSIFFIKTYNALIFCKSLFNQLNILAVLSLVLMKSFVLMKSEDVYVRTEGETVDIRCTYPDDHIYTPKYFCRHPCTSVWLKVRRVVRSSQMEDTLWLILRGARVFTVSIKHLRLTDSGVYYCGLDQWFSHINNKVTLSVHPGGFYVNICEYDIAYNHLLIYIFHKNGFILKFPLFLFILSSSREQIYTNPENTHITSTWTPTLTSAGTSSSIQPNRDIIGPSRHFTLNYLQCSLQFTIAIIWIICIGWKRNTFSFLEK